MSSYNANIILAGRAPDIMGSLMRGQAAAGQQNALRVQNDLTNLYREQGAGIMSGDQNALNALAAIDPMAAMDMRGKQQAYRINEEQLKLSYQRAAQQTAQLAMNMDAATRQAEAEKLEKGLAGAAFFYKQQDREGYENFLRQNSLDPAQFPFEQFPAYAAGIKGAADALKGAGGTEYGLNPQFGTDAQGNPVMLQVGKDGTATQTQLPEGVSLSREPIRIDGGTSTILLDPITRQPIGEIPKNLGEAAGEEILGQESMKAGFEAFRNLATVNGSINNIDEAIAALDRGAKSGVIYNMLPNVTEASASLNTAMNQMGLDVISSVTFGALSEAEMNLAMETAVPRNLQPGDLKVWLERKRDAQLKARDALMNAARYLTTPGNTINTWLEEQQAGQQGQMPDFAMMDEAEFYNMDLTTLDAEGLQAWIARDNQLKGQQ